MKTKSLFLSLVLLALRGSLLGQTLTPAASSTGSITTNAANCNTTNACIILHLASSNVGYSVTASGTWTGTLTVEQSGDNQGSWTSATTTTANTLFTSPLTPGITDVRVRGSAAMTGTAVVTITASGPAILQQVSSASSSGAAPCVGAGCINAASSTYGAFHDAKIIVDGTWTSGTASGIQSAAQAQFTSADVGKTIWGFNGCNPANTAGTELATLGATQTTILSVQSATSITISAAPTSSPAGAGCLVYGHMDDVGLTAADAALGALSVCGVEQFPAAFGMISQPHFFTLPQACKQLPAFLSGVAMWGNGVQYRGWGKGVSRYFMAPWFDMTQCTRGTLNTACFVWVQQGLYEGFSLDGLVNTRSGTTSAKKLSEPGGYTMLRNMGLHGFGGADGDLDGIFNNCGSCNLAGPLLLENVTIQAWGSRSLHQNTGGTWAKGTSFSTGQATNGSAVLVETTGIYNSLGGNGYFGGFGVTNQSYIHNLGGIVNLGPSDICRPDVSGAANYCVRAVGGTTNINGSDISMNTGTAPNAGNGSIFCSGSGAIVNVTEATYQNIPLGAAAAGAIFTNAGCIVNELGGSFGILTGPTANTWNGTYNTDGRQLKASCTGVVTASLTTGGIYGTGPNITTSVCNASPNNAAPGALGAGVPMQGARTVYALQVSATAAGTNASSGVVTVMKNGVATTITCTVGVGTTCTDAAHSVAFADGDLITFQYTTQAADTLAGLKFVIHWL